MGKMKELTFYPGKGAGNNPGPRILYQQNWSSLTTEEAAEHSLPTRVTTDTRQSLAVMGRRTISMRKPGTQGLSKTRNG